MLSPQIAVRFSMLLYIHVPFCRSRCRYCSFYSTCAPPDLEASPLFQRYWATLWRELDWRAEETGNTPVESVFFGGGTPSLLPPRMLAAFLEGIATRFSLRQDAEISLEGNPESLRGRIGSFAAAGINRLSVGVQSLDDALLRLLGRCHSAEDARAVLREAHAAGIPNVGMDLIWGLPGQDLRHWLDTLRHSTALQPAHISTYALTLEAGTALAQAVSAGRLRVPHEEEQARMYTEGVALLESMGYPHYEISNFSRPRFRCRHNLGYWNGSAYVGLGPAAVSTLGDCRRANPADMQAWMDAVDHRRAPDPELLDATSRIQEMIMLRLRTADGLSFEEYRQCSGRDFLADHGTYVELLRQHGLLHATPQRISLTCAGMLLSDAISAEFFHRMDACRKQV